MKLRKNRFFKTNSYLKNKNTTKKKIEVTVRNCAMSCVLIYLIRTNFIDISAFYPKVQIVFILL